MSDANRTTQALIGVWEAAQVRLESAKRELSASECALANAANALGKHLAPSDLKPSEVVAIWARLDSTHREVLLTISCDLERSTYHVKVRGRPREATTP